VVEVRSDAANAVNAEAAEHVRWQAADQVGIYAPPAWHLGVWRLCTSGRQQALPTHFVRSLKLDGRYKSRLVAGGHKQRPGIDFNEAFALVYSYRTLRMMLAVAAHAGLVLRQFDIKTAFLHGHFKEEVHVRPPRGWEHLAGGPNKSDTLFL
jgi:hypothetical protein